MLQIFDRGFCVLRTHRQKGREGVTKGKLPALIKALSLCYSLTDVPKVPSGSPFEL
jgi:hypothetical protein